jgi:SpoIID/LytB domain protein
VGEIRKILVLIGVSVLGLASAAPASAQSQPINQKLRVLVFPHIRQFATPQGKEAVLNYVQLHSEKPCATRPVGQPRSRNVLRGNEVTFDLATFTQPVRVECQAPVTVLRELPLKSLTYSGALEVYAYGGTELPPHLLIVNIVDLEEYLRGVVPAEMPTEWPKEAIKAQAIAARSYGLWEALQARAYDPKRVWEIDDTIQYQAYTGRTAVDPASDLAIRETAGKTLYHDGKVIKAYFHSDSGGFTEDASAVFDIPAAPYCVAKKEVYPPEQAPAGWQKSFTAKDLAAKLIASGLLPSGTQVLGISVEEKTRTASGRASELYVKTAANKFVRIGALEFRLAAGLRSALFSVKAASAGNFVFEGKGFGHGVGMSQWGARGYAELGYDYRKILQTYYSGVSIIKDGM